ncbi:dihydroorotate dehydrogenase [Thioclava sp. BHET1]|nr:dihydroorotate dehydrogenase [Thioclava sp. BHET1]
MDDDIPEALDRELEALFAAERQREPELSGDLMARILADADQLQAERARPAPVVTRAPQGGGLARFWRGLVDTLGGGGMAGILTAALAGLWLGIAQPGDFAPLTQSVAQSLIGDSSALDQIDLIPTVDTVLTGE